MAESNFIEKVDRLNEMGINPYPYEFDQTHHSTEIIEHYNELEGKEVGVAGRVMNIRKMGGIYFLVLRDQEGDIQIMVRKNYADQRSFELLSSIIDRGDIIGVKGTVTKSNRGEISVDCKELTILSKTLKILPEKFHGLKDVEERYRNRSLDLIMNLDVRKKFIIRSKVLTYFRGFLDSKGFIEFETPVLQPTYGGAYAAPFTTKYNAIDEIAYLRISDELYLKRLIIGGYEAVYEVSKDFRNEDIDTTHNPEFTQIEFYRAYKDYNYTMSLAEELVSSMAEHILGTTKIHFNGKDIDLTPPFRRIYWVDEVRKRSGIDVLKLKDEELDEIIKSEELEVGIKDTIHVADALLDKYIKPELTQPTFVVDYPVYMSPLAKVKRGNPLLAERFEMYIGGMELGNAYSEESNPIEQRKKFEQQEEERKKGDSEVPPSDTDFLEAMEYGMPPTTGMGIAIERLSMLLTDSPSIKEVILFPAMKRKK
ncbi:MAG: lysine--tRNA ligase [Candidatus Micrarchaeota archaeon]|nr:MAG: lysine--tRNA ligase [Candidatus Micrarchaeota archaeon]